MADDTHHTHPATREAKADAALVDALLALYPAQLTLAELARELAGPAAETEDAARRLVAGGLVHRHGEFLFPTRATLYLSDLFERRG